MTYPNPYYIETEDVRCGTCDLPARWERALAAAVRVCSGCNHIEDDCDCLCPDCGLAGCPGHEEGR